MTVVVNGRTKFLGMGGSDWHTVSLYSYFAFLHLQSHGAELKALGVEVEYASPPSYPNLKITRNQHHPSLPPRNHAAFEQRAAVEVASSWQVQQVRQQACTEIPWKEF